MFSHKENLVLRLERTIASLERAPVEKRRPIYANVLKFAELYPTKTRVAVFAPTRGEGGAVVPLGMRGCSSSVTSGAEGENRTRTDRLRSAGF